MCCRGSLNIKIIQNWVQVTSPCSQFYVTWQHCIVVPAPKLAGTEKLIPSRRLQLRRSFFLDWQRVLLLWHCRHWPELSGDHLVFQVYENSAETGRRLLPALAQRPMLSASCSTGLSDKNSPLTILLPTISLRRQIEHFAVFLWNCLDSGFPPLKKSARKCSSWSGPEYWNTQKPLHLFSKMRRGTWKFWNFARPELVASNKVAKYAELSLQGEFVRLW